MRNAMVVTALFVVGVALPAGAGASSGPVVARTGTVCASSNPKATAEGKGCVDSWTYTASRDDSAAGVASGEAKSYLVYVPAGWRTTDHLPLYLMVHGCGTTGAQQMGANLLNPIADRERFLVAYPDNGGQCWPAVSQDVLAAPATGVNDITRGGGGAADDLAEITRQVTAYYHGDRRHVYMMGMSSGSFQTSATAAAYPELYAAIGVDAGPGYGMAVSCVGYPNEAIPPYAQATVSQMGSRAHVMPVFAIGGTRDQLGEQPGVGGCARLAYLEWLYADNLLHPSPYQAAPTGSCVLLPPKPVAAVGQAVNAWACKETYAPDPYSTKTGRVPDGYRWTKQVARGPGGCEIAENWLVHGMNHYWAGGATDPQYTNPTSESPTSPQGFNDPKGPSASQLSWDFFKQFTLEGGNRACGR